MMKEVFPDQIWFDKGNINYVQSHDNKGSRLKNKGRGRNRDYPNQRASTSANERIPMKKVRKRYAPEAKSR